MAKEMDRVLHGVAQYIEADEDYVITVCGRSFAAVSMRVTEAPTRVTCLRCYPRG